MIIAELTVFEEDGFTVKYEKEFSSFSRAMQHVRNPKNKINKYEIHERRC